MLGADKEKVHRDQTPEETAKMQCLTGEVAVRVKTNVIVIFIWPLLWLLHVFAQTENIIGCYFPIFQLVLSLLCIISGYIRMLCGNVCVVVANIKTRTCDVWWMSCILGFVMYHTYILFKNTFPSEVSVLSDIRPFRNLTFYNVLAQQGSSFSNFPSFRVVWH